jgi:hypothetical protein
MAPIHREESRSAFGPVACGHGLHTTADHCRPLRDSEQSNPSSRTMALESTQPLTELGIGRTADFGRWFSVAQWSDASQRA